MAHSFLVDLVANTDSNLKATVSRMSNKLTSFIGKAPHALGRSEPHQHAAAAPNAPSTARGTITRVVGDDLVYVVTEAQVPFVFTPDKIHGYRGQHLKAIGVTEGSKVRVTIDATGHTTFTVAENR
jgi:hypothetical protein